MNHFLDSDEPLVIAHRGASMDAPENTAIAFELAARQGASVIETDLHLTKDGQIIIIHDETVNKTTDGKGRVLDMTVNQLKTLDAGSWFGNEFLQQRLLTLPELIALLDKFNLDANLEIKPDAGMEGETSKVAAEILRQHWPKHKALPLISSFSPLALSTMQEVAPQLPRGLLLGDWHDNCAELVQKLDCVSVNLSRRQVKLADIKTIKALNKKIMIYTVNDPTQARQFFGWGVDAIFCDCPGYMLATLSE